MITVEELRTLDRRGERIDAWRIAFCLDQGMGGAVRLQFENAEQRRPALDQLDQRTNL